MTSKNDFIQSKTITVDFIFIHPSTTMYQQKHSNQDELNLRKSPKSTLRLLLSLFHEPTNRPKRLMAGIPKNLKQ